jgi:ribosomal protein L16 Arg81 hydroxylase
MATAHPTAPVLARLLDPITPEDFLEEYFGQKALFVRGKPGKFDWLFKASEMDGALGRAKELRAVFRGNREAVIRPEATRAMLAAGATICVTGIDRGHPTLARTATALKRELNYHGTVDCRCYQSASGGGFDIHYDARIATSLQIAGTKRWWYSEEPSIPLPRHNSGRGTEFWEEKRTPPPKNLTSVVLEPGDLLCLPAGCWHKAAAGKESLAINVAFEHNRHSVLDFTLNLLRQKLVGDPSWRETLPPALLPEDHDGAIPEVLLDLIQERLDQLRAALGAEGLPLSQDAVAHAWRQEVSTGIPPKKLKAPPALEKGSELQRRDPGPLQFSRLDGNRVALYVGTRWFSLPGEDLGFVQQLAKRRRFKAADAAGWIKPGGWEGAKKRLERLVAEGVLERLGGNP